MADDIVGDIGDVGGSTAGDTAGNIEADIGVQVVHMVGADSANMLRIHFVNNHVLLGVVLHMYVYCQE